MLPHRLADKYPEYQFSWPWAWLFPAHNTCRDPRSGKIVRYRMHEVNVQRAVKYARRKLDISVLPHCLRHAYASHCLDRGTNPRAIQKSMGHTSLETTMGYTHAEALSVCSPLDTLPITLTGRDFQNTRHYPAARAYFHPGGINSPAFIYPGFQTSRHLHVAPVASAPIHFRELSPQSSRSEMIRLEHHASRRHR